MCIRDRIQPDIQPRPEDGTADIGYDLVSKANDQVEFSAGWGQTGIIGKFSLTFTNFSLFDGTDYSKYSTSSQEDMNKMHKWICLLYTSRCV